MITTLLTALLFVIAPSPSTAMSTTATTAAPGPVVDVEPLCI